MKTPGHRINREGDCLRKQRPRGPGRDEQSAHSPGIPKQDDGDRGSEMCVLDQVSQIQFYDLEFLLLPVIPDFSKLPRLLIVYKI